MFGCGSMSPRLTFQVAALPDHRPQPGDAAGVAADRESVATDATVLIRGPTGTGKELVARALHHNSPRRDRPMVTINCAALQENAAGKRAVWPRERCVHRGASRPSTGLIEVAEGGTLFIDEIAEMSPGMQAKLLRVLENGHYRRVGGTQEQHADVRMIAATNKALEEEQKAGRFREDLFYRLNVVTVTLPPLRERRDDIPAVDRPFLDQAQIGKIKYQIEPDACR